MNRGRIDNPWVVAGMSLVLTLVIWAVLASPLPEHFTDGIPFSARTTPADRVIAMKSGDHLQLLYHFWLAADMIAGDTPWFHNLYEFNTGDDAERFEPGTYYAPFSLVYAAARPFIGDAGGWNTAGLASIWLACFCTWLLARRYTTSVWTAAAAGATAILLPHAWISLFGGSPTGFAVSLVPLTLLGLDLAVRNDRVGGGAIAGIGVLLAVSADTHVFFFTGLMIPAWCLFALCARPGLAWSSPRAWGRMVLALLPAVLGSLLALGLARLTASDAVAEAHLAGGRSLGEVALFSPHAEGFFSRALAGEENHVYLGFVLVVTLGAGTLLLLLQSARDMVATRGTGILPVSPGKPGLGEGHRQDARATPGLPPSGVRRVVLALLLVGGLLAVLLLALGPNGPFESKAFTAARRLIPPYRMIRQPAKVMCVAPALFAVLTALVLPALSRLFKDGRFMRILLAVLFVVALAVEMRTFLQPGICLLDDTQGAYHAVTEDAAVRGEDPRLLVITLWPGDSDYASVYQHYVRLYRIRMVNGYFPFIGPEYREQIFERFQSANLGLLDDGQLEELLERGIRYLAVHEDLFPEKVSPFPVAHTLARLEAHPRLTRIGADGPVRSYRIEAEAGDDDPPAAAACDFFFPARRWEAERQHLDGGKAVRDNLASRGAFLALSAGDAVTARTTTMVPAPDLRYLLRVKGRGTFHLIEEARGASTNETVVAIDEDAWALVEVDAAPVTEAVTVTPVIICEQGAVDLDVVVLTAGEKVRPLFIGDSVQVPASCFFHAGYTNPGEESVHLRPAREPGRVLLYGPKLPLETGTYMVQFETESRRASPVRVGQVDVRWSNGDAGPVADVKSSGTAELVFEQKHNLPVFIAFTYNRSVEVAITQVTFSRVGR